MLWKCWWNKLTYVQNSEMDIYEENLLPVLALSVSPSCVCLQRLRPLLTSLRTDSVIFPHKFNFEKCLQYSLCLSLEQRLTEIKRELCSAVERGNKKNHLNTAHFQWTCPPAFASHNSSYMIDLHWTGWPISCPKISLSQEISKNQEKFEKNIWNVFKNRTLPKQDKITLYLDMVRDDRLTHNSII